MKKRVIVVDDEAEIAEAISVVLRRKGFIVDTFYVQEDAIEHYRKKGCDFILTDHDMLGITGAELIRRVKKISPVRCIGMSGRDNEESFSRAGCDAILRKPFTREKLTEVLKSLRLL